MSSSSSKLVSNITIASGAILLVVALAVSIGTQEIEAKLLGRQRFYEDSYAGEGGPGLYGGATGERAIITVRGARNPYNGHAPSKMTIEDDPYRGPLPRGVYDRLDGGYNRRPMPYGGGYGGYPQSAIGGYSGGYGGGSSGYGGGYGGGYISGRYNSMFGAPARIAVTGAFPYRA